MVGHEDGEYGAYAPQRGPHAPSRGQKLVNLAGAAGSIALVVSLGYWGWQLAVRDVRGVPVVRAAEGAMRVAPETPGGQVVSHQGLAVNDVAAKDGATGSDKLILAPAPVLLAQEDIAGLASALPPLQAGLSPDSPVSPAMPTAPPPEPLLVTQEDAVNAALAEALGLEDGAGEEGSAEDGLADMAALAPTEPAPQGALTRSPRPMLRPAAVADLGAEADEGATPSAEVDPASLTPGTRLVQFGAFESPDLARAEWTRIQTRLGDLMNGKAMVIQTATSGGQTFYRLRGLGFGSEDDARRFCSAAKADSVTCVPVAHR